MVLMLTRAQARAFYDRFGARQDSQAFYEDPAINALLPHAGFEQASAVLEFGCGTGRLARRLLSEQLPATASYVGCDASATMVALARRRLADFGGRARVVLTDGAMNLPAPDGSVDRFLSTYVLDLLPAEDMTALLAEAHRVLREGGRLCLAGLTHGPCGWSRWVSRLWERLHARRPALVGGCRPVEVASFLEPAHWLLRHRAVVTAYGIPSEVLVAAAR
jgi:ubiquinone/menaquinone biosynthesis C-methylase UbiE